MYKPQGQLLLPEGLFYYLNHRNMENPHKPLLFGPKTKGGHEVMHLHFMTDGISVILQHKGEIFQQHYNHEGNKEKSWNTYADDFTWGEAYSAALVPCTLAEELAPQPYTFWQKEQENGKLKAENQRYREALEELSSKTPGKPEVRLAGGFHYGSKVACIAREALKGGGDE